MCWVTFTVVMGNWCLIAVILKSHRAIGAGRVRQGQIPLQSQRGVTGPVTPAGVEICLFPAESESQGRASHPCRCGDMFISCRAREPRQGQSPRRCGNNISFCRKTNPGILGKPTFWCYKCCIKCDRCQVTVVCMSLYVTVNISITASMHQLRLWNVMVTFRSAGVIGVYWVVCWFWQCLHGLLTFSVHSVLSLSPGCFNAVFGIMPVYIVTNK